MYMTKKDFVHIYVKLYIFFGQEIKIISTCVENVKEFINRDEKSSLRKHNSVNRDIT